MMSLQGKMPAYDYYMGLEKLTDCTGLTRVDEHATALSVYLVVFDDM
jgi:hypothetical protein